VPPARKTASAAKTASRGKAKNPVVAPDDLRPAPVVLVVGAEGVLADRAVEAVLVAARAADPETEVERVEAAAYQAGRLSVSTSPSLFGGAKVVVIEALEAANEAVVTDLTQYLKAPSPDACVVIRHSGAARARQVVEAARAIGAPEASCQPVTRDDEKVELAAAEFARARRKIAPTALRALVDAVGSDLRELLAGCAQLILDTDTDRIEPQDVELYFGGRVEVTGFRVADAAVAGRREEALIMLRQALATGADPVPLVAALAAKVRAMAKVSVAGRGRSGDLARQLGMAPWQVDRARRDLSGWTDEGLARAMSALADADTMVKGGGRDPVYAVERLVLDIACRGDVPARPPVRPRRIIR
jgi:DNA polymerase-3 subunit delta